MKKNKITHLSGVPYSYEMLKKLKFFDMDLPYLETLTQAGGKLSKELHEEFHNFCVKKNKDFSLCMVKQKQLQEFHISLLKRN